MNTITTIPELYEKFLECNNLVTTDTRKNLKNSLFFCLKGDNFDGNIFSHQAAEKGAKFVVVDNPSYQNEKTLLVENTLVALQHLARFHREKMAVPVIAITGTNGKTTSKELLFSVLKQNFETICTQGNLNNHIGVPLTLLSIKPSTKIAIVEMGASAAHEIAQLCQIALPNYGYITNFGKAHLQGFISEEGVVKAKMELYDFLTQKEGVIFYNLDNQRQFARLSNYEKTFSFSFKNEKANVFLSKFMRNEKAGVVFQKVDFQSQLVGIYNTDNIAFAIAVGCYFKMSLSQILKGIQEYIPTNNRSQIIETSKGNKILLDAYNANPSSMEVALENFNFIEHQQKIIVLGEMKELGDESIVEHQKLVEELKKIKVSEIFLIGKLFDFTADFQRFETTEKAILFFCEKKYKNVFLLIKGSRAMKLEQLVPCF